MVVLSAILIFVDNHKRHLEGFRATLGTLITPILYLADIPREFFTWSGESLVTRSKLRSENKQLKEESRILKAQLQKYITLQAENARLKNLLGTENDFSERRVMAEIIQIDSDPFILDFIINKGALQSVYVGQTVIDSQGIVGQVVSVFPTTSRVLMISDETHAIPVRVARNNVRAIVTGSGQINRLFLKNVTDTTDIQEGDLLLSSGLGQIFPKGYPVAKISQVAHDPGKAYAIIFAKPTAQLEELSSVLLIWSEHEKRPTRMKQ